MFRLVLLAGICVISISAQSYAQRIGNWHSESVQGFNKYWTETSNGSRFTIWCNPGRKIAGTVIDIDIEGRNAPARRNIRVVVDRKMIKMPADRRGFVQTDCAACADSYQVLWNRLRSGVRLTVQFDDARYAAFSLKGAREILSSRICPADFYK